MRLYHYTGSEHVRGIQREGIHGGGVPRPDLRGGFWGFQWLTDSDDWQQRWATRQTVHCDRTEARFRVHIPRSHAAKVVRWNEVARAFGYSPERLAEFEAEGGGGAEHWWLYMGDIPPGWVRAVSWRPGFQQEQAA